MNTTLSGECLEVGENYLDIPNQLVRGNGTTQECWYEKGVVIGGLSVHKDKALTRMSGI